MKNKKYVLIAAVALLLVGLLVFALLRGSRQTPANPDQTVEAPQETSVSSEKSTELPSQVETAAEQTEPEVTDAPQLIESEEEVIIYVPEDQETDGF